MAEQLKEDVEEVGKKEDKLPALNTPMAWMKITGVLVLLILINITVFLVSFGVGVIVTIPLTLFLAFLMLRDIVPRHRFPTGRSRKGNPS